MSDTGSAQTLLVSASSKVLARLDKKRGASASSTPALVASAHPGPLPVSHHAAHQPMAVEPAVTVRGFQGIGTVATSLVERTDADDPGLSSPKDNLWQPTTRYGDPI